MLPAVTFTVKLIGLLTVMLFTCIPWVGFTTVMPWTKFVETPFTVIFAVDPALNVLALSEPI
jgi:hypothetical protein